MEEAKQTLIAMGFDATAAESALQETAGNIEQAANYLLMGGGGGGGGEGGSRSSNINATTAATPSSANVPVVQGNMSQYSVDNGRSACTYMALQAAKAFLQIVVTNNNSNDPAASITPHFLDSMVQQGSQIYNEQQLRANPSSTVEHTSAEDALRAVPSFAAHLELRPGGIRQGVLSHDPDHPLGLQALLSACQDAARWTCVVLTKTPETVLVCLPPSSTAFATSTNDGNNNNNNNNEYLWIDSHPRPPAYEQAACVRHASLADLVQGTAVRVFPVTDLGADVPELMATMYNSFDLYPLQWKE